MNDIIDSTIHYNIYKKLTFLRHNNKIPHIIFYGPSGSGKKTLMHRFINDIYHDKNHIKDNVLFVNCCHGKGIKFIREELKFFAKTNIQKGEEVAFKSIILLNADFLTVDAQSALRRCIELFSHNTRFFIIVENKNKLLNPILSRFCEICVPLPEMGNLHQYYMSMRSSYCNLLSGFENQVLTPVQITDIVTEWYEKGFSSLDIIQSLTIQKETIQKENHPRDQIQKERDELKNETIVFYYKIKSEFRCEKMLMFALLHFYMYGTSQDLIKIGGV